MVRVRKHETLSITGGQIRAARAFVQWTVAQLAQRAEVGLSTIQRAEDALGVPNITRANAAAIRRAFEDAGVEFIEQNGGGEGVRMRLPPPE